MHYLLICQTTVLMIKDNEKIVSSKMSCCRHLILFLIGVQIILGKEPIFNVDTDNPIIFKPAAGSQNGDHFGQGLTIQENVAIVGAPKADTHGKIFTCDFDGKKRYPGPIFCTETRGKMSYLTFSIYVQVRFS